MSMYRNVEIKHEVVFFSYNNICRVSRNLFEHETTIPRVQTSCEEPYFKRFAVLENSVSSRTEVSFRKHGAVSWFQLTSQQEIKKVRSQRRFGIYMHLADAEK